MLLKGKNKYQLFVCLTWLAFTACESGHISTEQSENDSLRKVQQQARIDSMKRSNPLLILPPDSDYTGTFIDRYENGIVKYRGFFRFGERHGQWMSFYPNGSAWSEMHYDQGKREGPNIAYFPNGQIRYSGIYRNDQRDSIWVYYDSIGNVAERVLFKNDRIVKKLGRTNP